MIDERPLSGAKRTSILVNFREMQGLLSAKSGREIGQFAEADICLPE
jgi:hypothetical protein